MIVPGRDFSTPLTPRPGLERRPDELGLGWLVKHDGRDFPGREALLKARETGPRHALRGARIEGRVRPANGAPLFARIDGEKVRVGCLTSSAWSCGLGCIVALASVDGEHRDAIGIDERITYLAWLFQLGGGVFKSPWSKQETWTLSVWHSDEDVRRYVDNFEAFAAAVTS